jgi:hypothetical protein
MCQMVFKIRSSALDSSCGSLSRREFMLVFFILFFTQEGHALQACYFAFVF